MFYPCESHVFILTGESLIEGEGGWICIKHLLVTVFIKARKLILNITSKGCFLEAIHKTS